MEVNWTSIRNIQYFGEKKKSRKISNYTLNEEISFLNFLNNAFEKDRSPTQKSKSKECLIDCEA